MSPGTTNEIRADTRADGKLSLSCPRQAKPNLTENYPSCRSDDEIATALDAMIGRKEKARANAVGNVALPVVPVHLQAKARPKYDLTI